jgi:signal transduction histidine kinase
MLDTLILNTAPVKAPRWLNVFLTALISLLAMFVVLKEKPTRGLIVLGATIGVFVLVCYLAFWLGGYWITMAHPMLAIFISYYFFIPYRLIIENRRSWEYYQKHKLLTQVEELKTNFLRMMSHDLKTPIARIQGMTDIIAKDRNHLSEKQTEALKTLARSSQELLEFVSSILHLTRIESSEIKLHLSSRDLNSLLRSVVDQLDYLSVKKNITVSLELEPLFSVRIDADLIKQVFTNLIENAIKYSPENSRVLITTEENNGCIIVQIADQGAGIPEDELARIFTKFYRSRSAKASSVKGSGLGLYLAKYFVELHNGTVSVDSREGEGSTFTIEIPATA